MINQQNQQNPNQNQKPEPFRILVLGPSGYGKSHFSKFHIADKYNMPLIWIDPKGTDQWMTDSFQGNIVHSMEELKGTKDFNSLLFRPSIATNQLEQIDGLFEQVITYKVGEHESGEGTKPLLLVIDETTNIGTKMKSMASYRKVVYESRSADVSVVLILQNMQDIQNPLIGQCKEIYFFGRHPINDDYIHRKMKRDLRQDEAWLMKDDPPFNGLCWNAKGGWEYVNTDGRRYDESLLELVRNDRQQEREQTTQFREEQEPVSEV